MCDVVACANSPLQISARSRLARVITSLSVGVRGARYVGSQFHTMVLKGLPVFTMDSMTELRRFITLVDELYQYKVKLICTAQAPLEKLFQLNKDAVLDEVFACDRTLSRLEEMQTARYLQTLHFLQKPKLEISE